MGAAIPKCLPNYTLACPPAESYIKQFMPNSGGSNTARVQKNPHKFGETAPNGFFSNRGKENVGDKGTKDDGLKPSVLAQIKKDVVILEYVDYSSKYGVGYLLSDNCYGVFFNDSTKILFHPELQTMHYIDRKTNDKEDQIYSF